MIKKFSERGQVIIVLLLTTLVVLTVGFAITVRSLTDLTTSSRNDQSQRAFSAAEAGIEKYLSQPATVTGLNPNVVPFSNGASVDVFANVDVPSGVNQALEYPPIGKETIAQFWFVDPNSTSVNPVKVYTGSTFEIYFGNSGESTITPTAPAVEVNVITYNSATNLYGTQKFYLDPNSARAATNRFITIPNVSCGPTISTESTTSNPSSFACKYTVNFVTPPSPIVACGGTCFPVIVRARLLYSTTNQKIAVKGVGSALPKQAQIYYARGNAGQSQQILRVFKMPKVLPTFIDFAIFSLGNISK